MSALGMLTRAIQNQIGPPVALGGRQSGFNFGSSTSAASELTVTKASSTMYGIINRLSVSTAKVDWELMRNMGTGNEEDDEPVESHLALDVFNNPNPFMSRQEWFEIMQQHLDLPGESWNVFGKTGKWPTSIWPVMPPNMSPVKSPTKYLTGYMYQSQGEKAPLEISDVMFIRIPDPNDLYRGLGPVPALLGTIDAMRFGAEWNRNVFLNGAEPGGVITMPDNLSEEDFDQFNKRWAEMHRGVANANRIALLEGGMSWVGNSYSAKDMQFVELQTVGRDIIYEAYGMPKSAMGVTEDVNRANAATGRELLTEELIIPRLDRIKRAVNKDFLPQFGPTAKGLYFTYKDPVPPNTEEARADLAAGAQAALWLNQCGEYDPAEILEACGLPQITLKPKPDPVPVVPPAPPVAPETDPAKEPVPA